MINIKIKYLLTMIMVSIWCSACSSLNVSNSDRNSVEEAAYDSVILYEENPNLRLSLGQGSQHAQPQFQVKPGRSCDKYKTSHPSKICEPNYKVKVSTVPTSLSTIADFYAKPYGYDIEIPQVSFNQKQLIIAVLDTGIDLRLHPELKQYLWVNKGEIPNNGIDDDNNGYIDDINGWNFIHNQSDLTDDSGHGTHVSGTILSVIAQNPNVKLMVLKFMHNNQGNIGNAMKAINYAINNGAQLSNHSYITEGYSQQFENNIKVAQYNNHILIASAGNEGQNVDDQPKYPASFKVNNIITVGALNSNHQRALFSNYGSDVDIFSPGVSIKSLGVRSQYSYQSGTSMAAPFVTGILGLGITSSIQDIMNLKSIILNTTDINNAINVAGFISNIQDSFICWSPENNN